MANSIAYTKNYTAVLDEVYTRMCVSNRAYPHSPMFGIA